MPHEDTPWPDEPQGAPAASSGASLALPSPEDPSEHTEGLFSGAYSTGEGIESAEIRTPRSEGADFQIGKNASLSVFDHFPFDALRPAQTRAFEAFTKLQERGKSFGVFEMPTGAGKSPTAIAFGSWAVAHVASKNAGKIKPGSGAYILTTQKTLQQQYLRDFTDAGLVDMRGASNYPCDKHDTDCAVGKLIKAGKVKKAEKPGDALEEPDGDDAETLECGYCPYAEAYKDFILSPVGLTNFAYFLGASKGKGFKKRQLLIVDEAHNTESQLLGFAEIVITPHRCKDIGTLPPPRIDFGDAKTALDWVRGDFLTAAGNYKAFLEAEVEQAIGPAKVKMAQKLNGLKLFYDKMVTGLTGDTRDWFAHTDSQSGDLKIRPLTGAAIARDMLYDKAEQVLFLSATILDGASFIRGLGLDGADGGFVKVDSDFPVENRPIYFKPIGSMSYKNKDKSLPTMLRAIEKLVRRYPDQKGLIHAQSYALQQAIVDHLDDVGLGDRVIHHDNKTRMDAIERHVTDPGPTVLVSPSMTEGLDLAEDLSRFQIMPKVPYLNLGDPFIKARMERDPAWFQWSTALAIVQASGRSVRSRTDKADTWLLDADFGGFIARNNHILPKWWLSALIE